MAKQYRVKAVRMKNDQVVQFLQIKRWFGWQTIDHEFVPAHVTISLGCFGDTGGWTSKFTEYGEFGRDGIIKTQPKRS